MQVVLIAGATGYLGRHLCAQYRARGWYVRALVRDAQRANDLECDEMIVAQATRPDTLCGVMAGVDLVVSALGLTRQADGLGYQQVDYQANLNLLDEALRAQVARFAYIHVLHGDQMGQVPLVAAKTRFVKALQGADICSCVIAPSGYFSDMADILAMARAGRVWLFGSGALRLNPIHGADLAQATAEAVEADLGWLDVGGPDVFTQRELAEAGFAALGKPARITCLPDILRRGALALLPWISPRRIHGPGVFFLTALGLDMVGTPHGTHHLRGYFEACAQTQPGDPR